LYDWYENETLDWGEVVAVEGVPRDFEFLVKLKEKTFVYILCSYYVYFTENVMYLYYKEQKTLLFVSQYFSDFVL